MQIVPGRGGRPAKTLARALRRARAASIAVEPCRHLYETRRRGQRRASRLTSMPVALLATQPAGAGPVAPAEADRAHRPGGGAAGPGVHARSTSTSSTIRAYHELVATGAKPCRGPGSGRSSCPIRSSQERPFVLRPLLDIAPDWRHPVLEPEREELWRRVQQAGAGQRAETALLRRSSPCFTLPGRCEPPK